MTDSQHIMPDQHVEDAIKREHFGTAYSLINAKILEAVLAFDKEAEAYWRNKKEDIMTQFRASRWGQFLKP